MLSRRGVVIFPEEFGPGWETQLSGSGLNVLGLHPNPLDGTLVKDAMQAFFTEENRAAVARLEAQGFVLEMEVHALSWLLPRSLHTTHPDWFRMDEKGERVADHNLCAANPEALACVSERAAELARVFHPASGRYHFWLDDVTDSRCHCARCRRYTAADAALLVYNAILRGLRTVDPHATQCYLAYHDTNEAPRLVEPEPGIYLEYAPMDRDLSRPIGDPASERNRREAAPLRELLACFGRDGAQVLDYWLDNSLLSGWRKPPKRFTLNLSTISEDAAYYEALGFETVTSFACYLGDEYAGLYGQRPDIAAYACALAGGYGPGEEAPTC